MARQRLGQHFLRSHGILERIARAACGSAAPLAVEIGPGRGALTEHLLRHARRVIAIELDTELAAALERRWNGDARVDIVNADATVIDPGQWGPGILAGNLPYYVATGIISRYVRRPGPLTSATFLIQEEVAARITAKPGTRDYGFFSVECQFLARPQYLFRVGPGAFDPPPKVDSAVIRLEPRTDLPDIAVERFLAFVSVCFRHKRKTLRNNLAALYPKDILDRQPGMGRRAEELTVQEFLDLYRAVALPARQTAANSREAEPGSGTEEIVDEPG